MRSRICSSWVLGLVLLVLPLAGCLQESSIPSQAVAAAEVASPTESPAVGPAETSGDLDPEEMMAEADAQSISTAPAKKVSTEIEVPANLKPSPATAEIIKLANAGVEESVMLSFITNSVGTFNLRAEEIIYLNDIGVPSAVVTAMIQWDHLLQESNLTMTAPEADLTAAVPSTSSVYPTTEPLLNGGQEPSNVVEPPTTVFDSAPGYSSVDYTVPADTEPSPTDYTDYYDALAPYGNWVDVGGYGRCWQPTVVVVNRGWTPYFNCGRWVYTDCGWYWMSDYSWGWAPFHYGRWFQHATLGWCWRPDRVWGPSWVCWRHDGDFCGWAPLPPGSRFVAGVGLTFRGHPARHDFTFGLTANHFRFVRANHFLDRDLPRHDLPRDHATRIFDHTVASSGIISRGRTVVNDGIPRGQIASATHANIRPVSLHNVTPTEGVGIRERFERNGRTLAVYRPDVQSRAPLTPTLSPSDGARERNASGGTGLQAGGNSTGIPGHTRLAHVQPQRPVTAPLTPALSPSDGERRTSSRTGQALILRGSDNARETAMTPGAVRTSRPTSNLQTAITPGAPAITPGALAMKPGGVAITHPGSPAISNPQNTRRVAPLNSLVVIGQNRNSQVAANQPDNRSSWNSHGRPASAYNQDTRYHSSRPAYDSGPANSQPQSPGQSTWWAQPTQPRPSDQEQSPHNREMTSHGGNWNATVQQPHQNPAPVHVPQQTYSAPVQSHQQHSAPVESHPAHSAPVESHHSHQAPVETHQSHSAPVESRPAQSAPAPAASSSSSSSSQNSSSHSSGRGR